MTLISNLLLVMTKFIEFILFWRPFCLRGSCVSGDVISVLMFRHSKTQNCLKLLMVLSPGNSPVSHLVVVEGTQLANKW